MPPGCSLERRAKRLDPPQFCPMRIVSLLVPIRSGVHQVYRNVVRELTSHDCSFTWLCSGSACLRHVAEEDLALRDEAVVARDTADGLRRTAALVNRVCEISPDILICNALGDPVDLNAVRYMPSSIPRILIVHSTSLATYRGARAVHDHVNATIAISPRMQADLIRSYGFSGDNVYFVPNGIDTAAYAGSAPRGHPVDRVRLLSHGRIENESKGVFWLPEILALLSHRAPNWELTVSGDGPIFLN